MTDRDEIILPPLPSLLDTSGINAYAEQYARAAVIADRELAGSLDQRLLRERLICAALSGLAANSTSDYLRGARNDAIANRAIDIADAIVERLEREDAA